MAKYRIETTDGSYEIETEDRPANIRPIPEDVVNESGLQDVSLTPVTAKGFEQQADIMAESKFGQKHPYITAAAATPVAKPLDFIAAAQGIAAAPQMARGITAAGEVIGGGLKQLMKHISSIKNAGTVEEARAAATAMEQAFKAEPEAQTKAAELIAKMTEKPQAAIEATKERLAGIPEQMIAKEQLANEVLQTHKQGMQAAEEAKGWMVDATKPGFQKAIESPETISGVLEQAQKGLAKGNMEPNLAQLYRKMLQEQKVFEKGSMAGAQAGQIQKKLGEHLGTLDKSFNDSRKGFEAISKQIENLPKEKQALISSTKRQLVQAQEELKKVQQEGKFLMEAAKSADKQQLADIAARGRLLVQKAHQLQKVKKTLKYAALGALGLSGYKIFH